MVQEFVKIFHQCARIYGILSAGVTAIPIRMHAKHKQQAFLLIKPDRARVLLMPTVRQRRTVVKQRVTAPVLEAAYHLPLRARTYGILSAVVMAILIRTVATHHGQAFLLIKPDRAAALPIPTVRQGRTVIKQRVIVLVPEAAYRLHYRARTYGSLSAGAMATPIRTVASHHGQKFPLPTLDRAHVHPIPTVRQTHTVKSQKAIVLVPGLAN